MHTSMVYEILKVTYRYRDVQSSAKNKHETNAMQ